MIGREDFELVEEYMLEGEKRFRLRLRGTNIVFNVAASNLDEAIDKAMELAKRLEIEKVLDKLRGLFES